MPTPVTYFTNARIKPNQAKAVKELGAKMAAIALADKNVLRYDWMVSEKGDRLFINESFADGKAFLQYVGNPKIGALVPQMMELIEMENLNVVGKVDADVRKVLTNFPNVTYFTPFTGRQVTTTTA